MGLKREGPIRLNAWTFTPEVGLLEHPEYGEQTVTGISLKVLRVLTDPVGRTVTKARFEREAWGDEVEKETLEKAISNVRKPFKGDRTIEFKSHKDLGYQLIVHEPKPAAVDSPFAAQPESPPRDERVFEGRREELARLDDAWSSPRTRVFVLAAVGGAGKSTLVARWKNRLLAQSGKGGVHRHFDWSFYNQGTNDRASSDEFITAALSVFGDEAVAMANASPSVKGSRLAALVTSSPTLLILDGLEPLQGPPDHTGEAALRDPAIAALLAGLALDNPGLCLITSRAKVRDSGGWPADAVVQRELGPLDPESGAAVLERYGVRGKPGDLRQASIDVKGHALTLTLMGSYFRVAFADDPNVDRRHTFGFKSADDEVQGGHAFRVIAAYEKLLQESGRHAELGILRLLGLFERPATPDCVAALKRAAIPGLSDALNDLPEQKWTAALHYIAKLGLLELVPWRRKRIQGYPEDIARKVMAAALHHEDIEPGDPTDLDDVPDLLVSGPSLDAHPLVREYFAQRIGEASAKAGHGRLYDHLCATVPFWPEGREGLYVLYDAIAHGCRAGRYQEAYERVFDDRVQRGIVGKQAYYSRTRFALLDMDLIALKSFFAEPWSRLEPALDGATQARILAETGFRLRTLNRLREALSMLKEGMRIAEEQKDWGRLAQYSCTLSEVHLLLGEVTAAVTAGALSVTYADRSGNPRLRAVRRATYGDALHQQGRIEDSKRLFAEAETVAPAVLLQGRFLDGLRSAQYSDVLLGEVERAAWRVFMWRDSAERGMDASRPDNTDLDSFRPVLDGVTARATVTAAFARQNHALLDEALDELTLGRVTLYAAILAKRVSGAAVDPARRYLDDCKAKLEEADRRDYQPSVHASIAWLSALVGEPSDADGPLGEALALAERGNMGLAQADIHLYRARLRRDPDALKESRRLVELHGYLRRVPEILDAEEAAKRW